MYVPLLHVVASKYNWLLPSIVLVLNETKLGGFLFVAKYLKRQKKDKKETKTGQL
jgi:hypothetical protein